MSILYKVLTSPGCSPIVCGTLPMQFPAEDLRCLIGENTFLDNQVHMAHNVKLGKNCMIAGQVGFAGSSILGDNVSIGGQAGVSGHLKVGNNVKIGGGSGVVKDIEDNSVVMGYPAVPLKEFLKKGKDVE